MHRGLTSRQQLPVLNLTRPILQATGDTASQQMVSCFRKLNLYMSKPLSGVD